MAFEKHILRVTLFKISDSKHFEPLIKSYLTLQSDAKKDGKPYILSVQAGPAKEDARNQGYTFVAQTKFASREDMDFYDKDCEAHHRLKESNKGRLDGPPLTVFFENMVE